MERTRSRWREAAFQQPLQRLVTLTVFLQAIIARTHSTPRSIQLDLEGWWGRRPQAERLRGEEALTQHFFESWSGPRPELGVGITHVARDGHTIHALSRVDFAVPQMYASGGTMATP